MKRTLLPGWLLLMAAVLCSPAVADTGFEPIEASLTDRAVVMQLPDGVRRVRLRIREADGTWKLRTVAHLEGSEGFLKLRIPDGVAEEDVEVAVSETDPFPYSYYQGQSSFDSTQSDGAGTPADGLSPTQFTEDNTADPNAQPAVEESDIWKWRGDTLYFFNQYRGLQVIDVSDPAAPERLASHRIPASGEQMYLHPSADLVILLTYDSESNNGEVVLVKHEATNELTRQAGFPVPGYILESRLVGTILYVVSRHTFEERTTDADGVEHIAWRSALAITKIDLTDPDHPVADPPLNLTSEQYNYWGAQVQATPEALLVSTNAYDSVRRQSLSTVHVVDISDPGADPVVTHHLPIEGQVRNKFNMRLDGDILTVVSQVWRWGAARERHASVETFDLSGASGNGLRLAQIEFANNETITATRFVGDLLYVVTFLRVDPLFVIDLSDAANPVIVSELVIPGFSTHLEPLGTEALISIGVEGSQIAASWFDVSDPADPSLASRVFIGAEDGWSWTEANWDPKALGFFPDDGFLLVPYQGSDPDRGWTSGVQIIEIGDRELIKRGRYDHEFPARRAKVLGTAVASISGRSVKTLDISDPDTPALLAELTLAWPADIVHRVGDHLVQVERGPSYFSFGGSSTNARLHVSPVGDPDELTTTVDLGPGRVAGSLLVGDCLWVAQLQTASIEADGVYTNLETFSATAVDVGNPAQPVVLGRGEKVGSSAGHPYYYSFGSDYTGEVLPDGSHLWYPAGHGTYFLPYDTAGPDIGLAGAPLGGDLFIPYIPQSGRVYTVATADKSAPEILACVDLAEKDHWNEGQFRLLGSVLHYGLSSSATIVKPDGTSEWRAHHFLGQLELADPAAPVKRDLVKLPGTFEHALGTPAGGIILFTSSHRSFYDAGIWSSELRIQALAFDGVEAFLVDELVLPNRGYGPKLFHERFVVLARSDYSAGYPYTSDLAVYEWPGTGSFRQLPTIETATPVYDLAVSHDILLASGGGDLTFIDFLDPAVADPAIVTATSSYFWQRLALVDIYQRAIAFIPRGLWGVDTVDFEGAFDTPPPPPSSPGQDPAAEWTTVPMALLPVHAASGEMPLGTLSALDDWMFTTSAVPLTYDEWARAMFGLAPGDPVPPAAEDTDRDGLTNEWEYFTGTHPDDALDGARVLSWMATDEQGAPRFYARVPVNLHLPDGFTVTPEWSLDLLDWSEGTAEMSITPDLFVPALVAESIPLVNAPSAVFVRLAFALPAE